MAHLVGVIEIVQGCLEYSNDRSFNQRDVYPYHLIGIGCWYLPGRNEVWAARLIPPSIFSCILGWEEINDDGEFASSESV